MVCKVDRGSYHRSSEFRDQRHFWSSEHNICMQPVSRSLYTSQILKSRKDSASNEETGFARLLHLTAASCGRGRGMALMAHPPEVVYQRFAESRREQPRSQPTHETVPVKCSHRSQKNDALLQTPSDVRFWVPMLVCCAYCQEIDEYDVTDI